MTIRNFDHWLSERGHVREAPLSALAGTRVGIDFNSYINKLLGADSFVAAVGGAPLALASQIEKDLQALEKANIKPVFVFSGIVARDRQKLLADDDERKRRGQAWEHYEQGRVPQAQQDFGLSNPLVTQDVIRLAHRLFKLRTVEFVVSPYLSLAQLVYLEKHPKAYIHSMYGPHELFLFDGVDRVILNLNFNTSTISFASKSAILSDLGVTPDQFLDISILSGFDSSPTFPGLDPNQFAFRSVVDLVKGRVNGMNVVLTFKDYPPVFNVNYLDTFVRSRCMIKFSLVLVAPEGRVLPLPIALPALIPPPTNGAPSSLPLTTSDVPVDLYDIFSPRLPDEVYYQLFRGLIGSRFISALATGYLIESTPLCGGTQEYERFIKALTELPQSARCVAIGLISSSLHPMWSKKPVAALYYFDPGREHVIPHSSHATLAFIDGVSKWNVDARHVEDELRRQVSSTIDLSLCLGGTSTPSLSQRTIVTKNVDKLLDKKDEIVANTLWRFLELRAFLTPSHQHTPHAQALYAAMRASKVNDKFQESLYLAVELLRTGALHNGRIGGRAWSGGPNFQGTEEDKRSMLLVMRVLSIVPMSFLPGPWSGPLSRELLVFNSFLRALSRSLRGLVESVALNLLLRSDARRTREDYLELALSLPFHSDTNTGMGILFKAFGDAVCHLAGGVDVMKRAGAGTKGGSGEEEAAVKEAKVQTLGLLDEAFPNVKNVTAELQRGLRFWHLVVLAVRTLRSSPERDKIITAELAAQFDAADKWLRPFAL